MRYPKPAIPAADITVSFCQKVLQHRSPITVQLLPKSGSPMMECFSIVPEHIATHGGEQLNGWAIWHVENLFIEAEFHTIWRSPDGDLVDLTPRLIPFDAITFLPDPEREYRSRQVDNIRYPLTDDRDVLRFLYLAKRRFEIFNKGDLADQHGEISLSGRALKDYRNLEKEMMQLDARLTRRYP